MIISTGGFCKLGPFCGCPHTARPSICGVDWGPDFWKLPYNNLGPRQGKPTQTNGHDYGYLRKPNAPLSYGIYFKQYEGSKFHLRSTP